MVKIINDTFRKESEFFLCKKIPLILFKISQIQLFQRQGYLLSVSAVMNPILHINKGLFMQHFDLLFINLWYFCMEH